VTFGRRIPKATKAEAAREELARGFGCICCFINVRDGIYQRAPSYITKNHCNSGGQNRGERFTFIACAWHHLGSSVEIRGVFLTQSEMARRYGPSLAKGSKPFRAVYGDDDSLIELTDQQIGWEDARE
jgi:hypothetical protein